MLEDIVHTGWSPEYKPNIHMRDNFPLIVLYEKKVCVLFLNNPQTVPYGQTFAA